MRSLLPQAVRYVKCNNRRRLGWLLARHPRLKTLAEGDCSLVWEAHWHNRGLLPWLLDQGVGPDVPNTAGGTLLMHAAAQDDVALLRLLLDRGADVNRRNENGETALSYCCAYDSLACAKLLAERGADVNTVDRGGGSPLDWAVCQSSPELREWLVSVGGRRHDDSYAPWPWPPQGNEGACRPAFDFGRAGS